MRRIYQRIAELVLIGIMCIGLNLYLKSNPEHVSNYIIYLFLPIQRFKSSLLNATAISIGDYLYLLLFLLLILFLARAVYYACTFARHKMRLINELLKISIFGMSIYLIFLISWGGNYYRSKLAGQWNDQLLDQSWNREALIQINHFLVDKLNDLSRSEIVYPSLEELNTTANHIYQEDFGHTLPQLKAKESRLGYLLNYAGVHGYYNPLSGEAQFNRDLPGFMHPFVVTHEMAHQAGIAAEDDANLLAYLIGIKSHNIAFQYSAYFNIFLYSYADLERRDSSEAKKVWQHLNGKSQHDYNTLLAIYKRYKSIIRGVSNDFYDYYLKWNGEQKGLDTYNMVVRWVYYWEFDTKEKADLKICPS